MGSKLKTIMLITAVLSLFGASGFAEGGCGDEAIERALCESATNKICDKWFSCWPAMSATAWGNLSSCKASVSTWCSNSEALLGCDVNNDMLRSCNNNIKNSACGLLPAECKSIFTCWTTK